VSDIEPDFLSIVRRSFETHRALLEEMRDRLSRLRANKFQVRVRLAELAQTLKERLK
jgi:hypothetical protein